MGGGVTSLCKWDKNNLLEELTFLFGGWWCGRDKLSNNKLNRKKFSEKRGGVGEAKEKESGMWNVDGLFPF